MFYPKGIIEDHGNSISLSLALDVSSLGSPFISRREIKLLVNYTLRVKDQIGGQHVQATGENDIMFKLNSFHTHMRIPVLNILVSYKISVMSYFMHKFFKCNS